MQDQAFPLNFSFSFIRIDLLDIFNVYLHFAVDGDEDGGFLDLFPIRRLISDLDFPVRYPLLYFREPAIVAYVSSLICKGSVSDTFLQV